MVRLDGVCDEVVLQPRDRELTVGERFFDGLLEAVCSSVVSEFSPVSDQPSEVSRIGGAEGSRTPDLVIANDALYQLSYGPGFPGPGGGGT
jgi:hypothetical protein